MRIRTYDKIIYEVYNPIEKKYYIGQSSFGLAVRKSAHKTKAKNNHKSPFHEAIRKHGFDIFEWKIIEVCENKEQLDIKEKYYISEYGFDNLYNTRTGGRFEYKLSENEKQNISKRMMGEKNHQFGIKKSKESMDRLKAQSMEVCSKKVVRLIDGKEYISISDCAKENNISIGCVSLHCNNKLKTQKYKFL